MGGKVLEANEEALSNPLLVEKDPQGEVRSRQITAVRFVPLTGGH